MNTTDQKSENQAIIDYVSAHGDVGLLSIEGTPVAAVPSGVRLQSVKALRDEYLTKPERLKGRARLATLASFIGHVQRFKDDGTAIFAGLGDKPWLMAVYDYHQGPAAPRFSEHRAEYAFPVSREWAEWAAIDGKAMEQGAFAAWMEDHLAAVVDPSIAQVQGAVDRLAAVEIKPGTPTQILTFSRGAELSVESNVVNSVSLATGGKKLLFDETIKGAAGAALDVPGGFVVALPLFDGGDDHALPVRLRLRVERGKVLWTLAILGAADVLREAVTAAAEQVRAATDVPLFYGTPEA